MAFDMGSGDDGDEDLFDSKKSQEEKELLDLYCDTICSLIRRSPNGGDVGYGDSEFDLEINGVVDLGCHCDEEHKWYWNRKINKKSYIQLEILLDMTPAKPPKFTLSVDISDDCLSDQVYTFRLKERQTLSELDLRMAIEHYKDHKLVASSEYVELDTIIH